MTDEILFASIPKLTCDIKREFTLEKIEMKQYFKLF